MHYKRIPKLFLIPFLIFYITTFLFSQETELDLDHYYKFPLALGLEYQSLSLLNEYKNKFNVYDISANIRWPIPPLPILQPALQFGLMQYESLDLENPEKWSHSHVYGMLGLAYSHKLTKTV